MVFQQIKYRGQFYDRIRQSGINTAADLLSHFNGDHKFDVQNFDADDGNINESFIQPVQKTAEEIKECFSSSQNPVWNLLEIGTSFTPFQYTPEPICNIDLLRRGIFHKS